jgi:hypothetical protein
MIPSRVSVDSTTKNTQTDGWDLTSSLTGTVKRRPTSLESCKSNSPTKSEGKAIDFPDDKRRKNAKDVVSAKCKVNKSGGESLQSEKEVTTGNVDDETVKKIDKKRFGKLAESAKKSFSKLPNRVSLARRTSPNNKLSLSQLEQKNNLFIRDGQQQQESGSDNKGEPKINKQEKIVEVVMESTAERNNPKQKQDKSNKKSSLIPAFLGGGSGSTKSAANHIKIPSTSSGSIKKAPSNVVEKLTKTGNKFKELYRDFPSVSPKRAPPPYRPPPPPEKRIRFVENDAKNYEEIDAISDEHVVVVDDNNDEIFAGGDGEMQSKAEYSSNVFKNIPVRQKKGNVSHMENYCLFDPSVDFTNEKELMKKKLAEAQFPINVEGEESIEDVTFEDQTVYDVSELDEREKILAHHNYYEIDPELLLEEDEANEHLEQMETVMEKVQTRAAKSKNRKSKIYSNTLSMSSSESTSTSQSSTNSSSTTTSSDYPSLFNSVIETTHSSTIESTDDNDSNGYGKTTSRPNGDTINQVNVAAVSNESVITISNVVTCGESNASSTGATKKKSPQLNRIIRPSSTTRNVALSKQQTTSLATKTKSTRIINKSDALKSSSSLQNVTVQNRCRQQKNGDLNFVIDNTTTIQLRRQRGRPLSGHSDDRDSGFLSPVTPPDSQHHPAHITPNVIVKESEQNTKSESTVLNQCDNVQQLIEVSKNSWSLCLKGW